MIIACSTPGGVGGVSTCRRENVTKTVTSVLDAWRRRRSQHRPDGRRNATYDWCSTPGGVGGVSTSSRWSRLSAATGAQRLAASEESAPDSLDEKSVASTCSTPGGVGGVSTLADRSEAHNGRCAQRLAASEESAPAEATVQKLHSLCSTPGGVGGVSTHEHSALPCALTCSTPGGVGGVSTTVRYSWRHEVQCAQRLAASEESAQPVRSTRPVGQLVLNAWRRRRSQHFEVGPCECGPCAQRLAASEESAHRFGLCATSATRCSTPGGVGGVSTSRLRVEHRLAGVLNAWRRRRSQHLGVILRSEHASACSTPGGVGGVSTSRSSATESTRPSAQRLAASEESAPDNLLARYTWHYVLNAWRRRRSQHGVIASCSSCCSDVLNAWRRRRSQHSNARRSRFSRGAQRLAASEESAPWTNALAARLRECSTPGGVGGVSTLATSMTSSTWSCAQRLAASEESAPIKHLIATVTVERAQRLAASEESAQRRHRRLAPMNRQCSTPGGVGGVSTQCVARLHQSECSTPGGVGGVSTGASIGAASRELVLNAWRRRRSQHVESLDCGWT